MPDVMPVGSDQLCGCAHGTQRSSGTGRKCAFIVSEVVASPFSHPLRVRYAECDKQGVVFNSHYLAWFDISMTELFRAAFGSYGVNLERGVDIVVGEARLRFRAPARFDDLVDLE